MGEKRFAGLFLAIGLVASTVIAISYWHLWLMLGYSLPAKSIAGFNISLSAWWDIPLIFLVVNFCALASRFFYKACFELLDVDISSPNAVKNANIAFSLCYIFSFVVGLVAYLDSLGSNLSISSGGNIYFFSIFFSLTIGLLACIILSLISGFDIGFFGAVGACLGFGFGVSIGLGFVFGFASGLAAAISVGLALGFMLLLLY